MYGCSRTEFPSSSNTECVPESFRFYRNNEIVVVVPYVRPCADKHVYVRTALCFLLDKVRICPDLAPNEALFFMITQNDIQKYHTYILPLFLQSHTDSYPGGQEYDISVRNCSEKKCLVHRQSPFAKVRTDHAHPVKQHNN